MRTLRRVRTNRRLRLPKRQQNSGRPPISRGLANDAAYSNLAVSSLLTAGRVVTRRLQANTIAITSSGFTNSHVVAKLATATYPTLNGTTTDLGYSNTTGGPILTLATISSGGVIHVTSNAVARWRVWVPTSGAKRKVRIALNRLLSTTSTDSDLNVTVTVNGTAHRLTRSNAVSDSATRPQENLYDTPVFDWNTDGVMTILITITGNPAIDATLNLIDDVIVI